jgi:hypothetical protein
VRLGKNMNVAQLNRVGHQQAERRDEQRRDAGLAGVSRRQVYPAAVHGQVAAVTEADGGVE